MTDRSHREKMCFDEQHGAAVNFCSVLQIGIFVCAGYEEIHCH